MTKLEDAQAECASTGLLGGYPLPLSYAAREAGKANGGFGYAVSLFARSLADKKYVLSSHPPFDMYMSGLLARPDIGPGDQNVQDHSKVRP